jgi:hypothetical protein
MQKEYPQFNVQAVRDREPYGDPLVVLGFTRFMSDVLDKQCAKKFKDSYVRVTGAVSNAKERLRNRLLATGLDYGLSDQG